ncbi:adenylate/guanylate cyclase domain-containing protein [Marinobacterium nitratireducens]|uniref:adenylate/guanylate cyclase domain-containing protein n=1 Tax=Marinobacterium nitratireducens TaxID=518897 RepID=UPI001E2AC6AF|nr:adenylate/guanylate cyclase domain-containing protein [Marinobacterium nitratireducens]
MLRCTGCGADLAKCCPACGTTLRASARFCDNCGNPLPAGLPDTAPIHHTPAHLVDRIRAEQAATGATAGERKIVTALFADIAASTSLVADLDPEDARRLIDPILALMMEAVHHYEGYVAKCLGDGILALFGAPIGHEDHPQRALFAALRMQQAMQQYAGRIRTEQGIALQIRVGANTGEVVVRSVRTEDLQVDYDPVGPSIHLASRMESLAPAGSIVVSEATFRLVQGYFEFRELGPQVVKGMSCAVNAYEVLGNGPLHTRLQLAERRGLARFVGRRPELAQLEAELQQVEAGNGRIVAVTGEPGVGKSRLFLQFKRRAQRGCRVLETFSVSHGKAFAYLPLIELLKQYLQFGPEDDEARRRQRIESRLEALGLATGSHLPYLCYLLGIAEPGSELSQQDAQTRRRRTLGTIRKLLLQESSRQPLVLIFEDLQWLDGETQTFLDVLAEAMESSPILLLLNHRPEYRHRWPADVHYAHIRLQALDRGEAAEMLESLLGTDASLAPLKPRIQAQTQGNPFFLEEVVQTLVEEQVLEGRIGHYRLVCELASLSIPTTVQGVLCARMDRLASDEKSLLQTLAVIGKEFPWSLVLQVVGLPEQRLRQQLNRLQSGEFLYERAAFPEVEFSFKHALTQEVAYNSMLRERRGELHERIGRAIESLFDGHIDAHCKELAHHYSRSGNLDKAVEYLHRAGRQAMLQSSVPEAVGHFGSALKLLDKLPPSGERDGIEFAIRLDFGPALIAAQGYAAPDIGTNYSRALELKGGAGTEHQLFPVLIGLRNFHHVRGQLHSGRDYAECLLALARRGQDPSLLLEAHRAMGSSCFNLGDPRAARLHFEQAVALYDRGQHQAHLYRYGLDPGVFARGYLAWVLAHLGCGEAARQCAEEALQLARELNISYVTNYALVLVAETDIELDDADRACEHAGAAAALAREQGYPFWGAWARVLLGAARARQGRARAGSAEIRAALLAFRDTGAELWCSHFLALLAEALGRAGEPGEGLRVLDDARQSIATTGEWMYRSEVERLEGELLLQQAAKADDELLAQACFERAIETGRRTGARAQEVRALLCLARLWLQQGRGKDARSMLEDVCSLGQDDCDLDAIRGLLAQIE